MRYILFWGNTYYPAGGVYDLAKVDNDLKALKEFVKHNKEEEDIDWWHIFDTNTMTIVDRSAASGYKP